MKKTVKAWAVANPPDGHPFFLSISWTRSEAIDKWCAYGTNTWEVWRKQGYRSSPITITYDDGRKK